MCSSTGYTYSNYEMVEVALYTLTPHLVKEKEQATLIKAREKDKSITGF